ncbi:MAG TPA: hypothetical protein PKY82_06860 [Pyrinomonadaceae bacterium]|nr:hypothetical protein [Pyrinomonadaceae bacterium]
MKEITVCGRLFTGLYSNVESVDGKITVIKKTVERNFNPKG